MTDTTTHRPPQIPGGAHPARDAARASMDFVQRKAREEWLGLFTDDAVVEDPVGPSPLDEQGVGHRGKEAIGAFWDATIANIDVAFDIRESYAAGNECANVGTITSYLPGGQQMQTDGVFVYRVDDDGKLVSLRAFWEFERAIATLRPVEDKESDGDEDAAPTDGDHPAEGAA